MAIVLMFTLVKSGGNLTPLIRIIALTQKQVKCNFSQHFTEQNLSTDGLGDSLETLHDCKKIT